MLGEDVSQRRGVPEDESTVAASEVRAAYRAGPLTATEVVKELMACQSTAIWHLKQIGKV